VAATITAQLVASSLPQDIGAILPRATLWQVARDRNARTGRAALFACLAPADCLSCDIPPSRRTAV